MHASLVKGYVDFSKLYISVRMPLSSIHLNYGLWNVDFILQSTEALKTYFSVA